MPAAIWIFFCKENIGGKVKTFPVREGNNITFNWQFTATTDLDSIASLIRYGMTKRRFAVKEMMKFVCPAIQKGCYKNSADALSVFDYAAKEIKI